MDHRSLKDPATEKIIIFFKYVYMYVYVFFKEEELTVNKEFKPQTTSTSFRVGAQPKPSK